MSVVSSFYAISFCYLTYFLLLVFTCKTIDDGYTATTFFK